MRSIASACLAVAIMLSAAAPARAWEQAMRPGDFGDSARVARAAGGDHLVAMRARSRVVPGYIWLARLDASGNRMAERALGNAAVSPPALAATRDGGFLISTLATRPGASEHELVTVRLTSELDLVWQVALASARRDEPMAIIETRDGGAVIACTPTSTVREALLVRLAPDGSLTWQRSLQGATRASLAAVLEDADGSLRLVGELDSEPWLLHLDADGSIVGQSILQGFPSRDGQALGATSDGGWLVAGLGCASHFSCSLGFAKLDASGVVSWASHVDGLQRAAIGVHGGAAGGALLVATTNNKAWIANSDPGGGIAWQRTFGGPDFASEARDLIVLPGGFLLAMATPETQLLRLDEAGQSAPTCLPVGDGDLAAGTLDVTLEPANATALDGDRTLVPAEWPLREARGVFTEARFDPQEHDWRARQGLNLRPSV